MYTGAIGVYLLNDIDMNFTPTILWYIFYRICYPQDDQTICFLATRTHSNEQASYSIDDWCAHAHTLQDERMELKE